MLTNISRGYYPKTPLSTRFRECNVVLANRRPQAICGILLTFCVSFVKWRRRKQESACGDVPHSVVPSKRLKLSWMPRYGFSNVEAQRASQPIGLLKLPA